MPNEDWIWTSSGHDLDRGGLTQSKFRLFSAGINAETKSVEVKGQWRGSKKKKRFIGLIQCVKAV